MRKKKIAKSGNPVEAFDLQMISDQLMRLKGMKIIRERENMVYGKKI